MPEARTGRGGDEGAVGPSRKFCGEGRGGGGAVTAMRGGGAEGAARAAGARLTSSRMSTKKRLLWRLALTTDREWRYLPLD